MIKKRIIGVVTIKNNLAVQSFSYSKYLPIGKPECVIENLDRWGADEILVQVIDRSIKNLGPDFNLLNRIGKIKTTTPIIYSGGIRNLKDSIEVIKKGADRIAVESIIRKNKEELSKISKYLGSQAVIASLPVLLNGNEIYGYDYITRNNFKINEDYLSIILNKNLVSEILLINKKTEGFSNSFDSKIITNIPKTDTSLILFGGISEVKQIDQLFSYNNVNAVGIGNFLNYKEHSIQSFKRSVNPKYLRKPNYCSINSYEDSIL